MEKTIKIGKQDVKLSNNISWAMIYANQFGHDILPTIMPLFAAGMDIISGMIDRYSDGGEIPVADVLKDLDGDKFIDAIVHLSGLEFVEVINITWALAKAANGEISAPTEWVKQFDTFPVDVIAPEVVKLVFKGVVSTKNQKRLRDLTKNLKVTQPSK